MIEQLTNLTTGRSASRARHTEDRWVLLNANRTVAHSENVPKLIAQAWIDGRLTRDEEIKDLVPAVPDQMPPEVMRAAIRVADWARAKGNDALADAVLALLGDE